MSRRVKTSCAAAALLVGWVLPSLASASSGGSGIPSGAAAANATPAVANVVQSGNITVSATGGGITVQSTASALLRKTLTFSGTVPSSDAGQTVVIERNGHETGWTWEPTVSTTAQGNGAFAASWTTNHIGQFSIRVVIQGAATAASASPAMTVTVYRPSLSTLYGPGFWGHQTACGQKLSRGTLGVANRTLKCGENVALYYKGRTLIVPVIDRGPYANGADWDLTMATGKALGIPGTVKIGAVSLPAQPQQH